MATRLTGSLTAVDGELGIYDTTVKWTGTASPNPAGVMEGTITFDDGTIVSYRTTVSEDGEPEEPASRSCIISYGGHDYAYDSANGTDLGDYHDNIGPLVGQGERFVMSCVRVTHPYSPIRVDFREIPGLWWCAVFDYGDAFDVANAANLPGPITVTIGGEDITLFGHPWGSRWRWQSGPWPFDLIPVADLVAAGLLLSFDPTVPRGNAGGGMSAVYTPLAYESVGLVAYMPTTGARGDIGYVTEMQAQWICGATGVEGVLAQGEACATVPWRLYDPEHGRTTDIVREHPAGVAILQVSSTFAVELAGSPNATVPTYVTVHSSEGREFGCVSKGGVLDEQGHARVLYEEQGYANVDPAGGTITDLPVGMTGTIIAESFVPNSGVYPESGHEPALSYLPFVITGDPFHLENLQSQAMFAFAEYGTGGDNRYTPGIVQTRGAAWNTRSIYQAAAVTPEDAPTWLLSREAMQAALDWCVAGMLSLIDTSPAPSNATFHDISPNTWASKASWQMDFYVLISAAAAKLHPAWMPILQWVVQNAVWRIDGKSGWGRGNPDPYQFFIGTPHDSYAETFYASWPEAWTGNTGGDAASAAASHLTMGTPPDSLDYINGLRGALAAATQVLADDDPLLDEVRACLNYLVPYHASWMENGYYCEFKWSQRWV